MPEHNPGQMGGTMRLGKRRTLFQTKNSIMSKAFLSPLLEMFPGDGWWDGEVRPGDVEAAALVGNGDQGIPVPPKVADSAGC